MDTNKRKLMANLYKMGANQHNMEATIRGGQEEMIKSIMGACRESMEACEEKTKALPETTKQIIEEFMVKMEAGLRAINKENLRKMEEKKPAADETEAAAESREVPKGGTDEETSAGIEDRTGEQRLAVRRHRQRKKRAQVNGEPRQKFAAFHGRFTHLTVPALLKGHVRKGPGRNRRTGIRGPGRTSGNRMEDRSLKKRRTKVNAVGGTPKGRTREKKR
jgi:hypothetical protein